MQKPVVSTIDKISGKLHNSSGFKAHKQLQEEPIRLLLTAASACAYAVLEIRTAIFRGEGK